MPVNRSEAARRTDPILNTRRAPHIGLPPQRRLIPAPDGVSKVGRSATARRGAHRADVNAASDVLTVPRGFPLGDSGHHAAAGQPGGTDVIGVDVTGVNEPAHPPLVGPVAELEREASGVARQPEGRVLRRVGTGRAPFRSAVLGGALLVAVLGAGVAAWAITASDVGSDRVVVNQVEDANRPAPSAAPSGSPSTPGSAAGGGISDSVPNGTNAHAAPDPAAATPADLPVDSGVISDPAVPPAADLGPATVSAIPPGDPGFGWPSTAFGLPAEPGN